jgi:hypothetical protein
MEPAETFHCSKKGRVLNLNLLSTGQELYGLQKDSGYCTKKKIITLNFPARNVNPSYKDPPLI